MINVYSNKLTVPVILLISIFIFTITVISNSIQSGLSDSGKTVIFHNGNTFEVFYPNQQIGAWITRHEPVLIEQKKFSTVNKPAISFDAINQYDTLLRLQKPITQNTKAQTNLFMFDFL